MINLDHLLDSITQQEKLELVCEVIKEKPRFSDLPFTPDSVLLTVHLANRILDTSPIYDSTVSRQVFNEWLLNNREKL